jgi:putative alpha-1,2-mannosidase
VLADSFVKGITDGVDWAVAYKAVVADAEISPKSFGLGGRGNIDAWREVGYVPVDDRDRRS